MNAKKPLILVTNDDGITAPGIRALIEVATTFGDVVVVAPDAPQSAMGHAITINDTIYCNSILIDKDAPQKEYSCSGTPVDCVKIAINELLDRKPDLCLSGVNHGSNSSINVIYSGTMSAAVEAGTVGIPSIGFSLLDYSLESSQALSYFLKTAITQEDFNTSVLEKFSKLDDYDIIGAMKSWQYHTDFVLKTLSSMLLNRDLLKIEIQHKEFPEHKISDKKQQVMQQYNLTEDQASYFVFSDTISNQAYRMDKDTINLVTKTGEVIDVARASDQLNIEALSKKVTKHYLCYPKAL